jgi:hypothetical protein
MRGCFGASLPTPALPPRPHVTGHTRSSARLRVLAGRSSFPKCAALAVRLGWRVEVYSWRDATSPCFPALAALSCGRLRVHHLDDWRAEFTVEVRRVRMRHADAGADAVGEGASGPWCIGDGRDVTPTGCVAWARTGRARGTRMGSGRRSGGGGEGRSPHVVRGVFSAWFLCV